MAAVCVGEGEAMQIPGEPEGGRKKDLQGKGRFDFYFILATNLSSSKVKRDGIYLKTTRS